MNRTASRLFLVVLVVAVALPAIGFWWASSVAKRAVEHRAVAGTAAASAAFAAQLQRQFQDRTALASDLLVLLANGAHVTDWADLARLSNPFCRVSLLAGDGTSAATLPLPTCPAMTSPAAAHGRPEQPRDADRVVAVQIRLNSAEHAAIDPRHRVMWLHAQFTVASLVTPLRFGTTGGYTVVDTTTGTILASSQAVAGSRISSSAARRAIARHRATTIQTWAPHLHSLVLASYTPVTGTDLGVFVSLPTNEAFADADHLRRQLLAGLAAISVIGTALALSVAIAVRRRDRALQDQLDTLQRLADTDPLTGLANRSALMSALRHDLALVRRALMPGLAVMFVDVDGLKRINDTQGHACGDEILVATARAIESQLRRTDTLARVGGDEFIIVVPGQNPDGALEVADRIIAAVSAANTAPGEEPSRVTGVTVSIGITFSDGHDDTADQLITAADTAMYAAKKVGGNGTSVAAKAAV